MAFTIKKADPYFPPKHQAKSAGYLEFIRQLPCVVTGKHGVEAAHVSFANPTYGHYGRAKTQKAADLFALPLSSEEHRIQHGMNEREYWAGTGIDPHLLCLKLFCVWSNYGAEAHPFAEAIIHQTRTAND
jgi:hypothetical protein